MTTSQPVTAELLELARYSAAQGAEVISHTLSREDIAVKEHPGDIVTQLDVTAEHRIRDIITVARPADRVVGEELSDAGALDAAFRWSLDPLDGTTNRVKGLPFYAASVAVQSTVDGEWLAGVVNAPELKKEYYAMRGEGAWVSTGAGTKQLRGPNPGAGNRLLSTGFSYDPSVRATQLLDLSRYMAHFDDMRSLGSAALGLCAVAEGSVDAFIESDLYEFDWAAAALIAEEAGAVVERPGGYRGGIVAYFGMDFR